MQVNKEVKFSTLCVYIPGAGFRTGDLLVFYDSYING